MTPEEVREMPASQMVEWFEYFKRKFPPAAS